MDVTVNQGTDTVLVRATFPNPDRILVDGQLVAVVAEGGTPPMAKPLSGFGSGVLELALAFRAMRSAWSMPCSLAPMCG